MLRRVLGGRYQAEELLGSGGMAAVWRSRDLRLDRPVAIKVLAGSGLTEPMALERFDREARAAARLAHPNVVGVYDFGTDDGDPYLVMELVEGRTVSAIVAEGPLPLTQAVAIALQACDGLMAAHAAGVVHRDIKPGNLIVTPAGVVKICDFGIARLPQAGQNTLTGAATVLGTTSYMAPEQATGNPVDARTDLYALGCTLYAMLAGAPPFVGDPLSVLHQHRNDPPAPLRTRRADIPPALDALVTELLAKEPADRPSDAAQVRTRLAAFAADPDTAASALTVVLMPRVTGAAGAASMAAAAASPGTSGSAGAPGLAGAAGSGSVPAGVAHAVAAGRRGGDPASKQRRWRGPAGVAAAVIGAVLLAATAIALLNSDRSSAPAAQPTATTTPSGAAVQPGPVANTAASTTPAPTSTATPTTQAPRTQARSSALARTTSPTPAPPTDPIVAMRLTIQQQVETGQLNPDAAKDLHSKVDAIARKIAEGDTDGAEDEIKKLRDKLAGLLEGGKLSSAGYRALVGNVDRIAATLQ